MEALMQEIGEKVLAGELVSEMIPILKDYFVANVERAGNGIRLTFLSGQTFFMDVREI